MFIITRDCVYMIIFVLISMGAVMKSAIALVGCWGMCCWLQPGFHLGFFVWGGRLCAKINCV